MEQPNILLSGRIPFGRVDLTEGRNDPSIFKAFFLIGAPGSGKDYVMKKLLLGYGLVEINSDKFYEMALHKHGIDLATGASSPASIPYRERAKVATSSKERLAIDGRLGLVINGTGADPEKYIGLKNKLEALGYDCMAIYVAVSNKVSRNRNIMRGQSGGRTIGEPVRYDKWKHVIRSAPQLEAAFGAGRFITINNSGGFDTIDSELVLRWNKTIRRFITTPPGPIAQAWIAAENHKAMREEAVPAHDNPKRKADELVRALPPLDRHNLAKMVGGIEKHGSVSAVHDAMVNHVIRHKLFK